MPSAAPAPLLPQFGRLFIFGGAALCLGVATAGWLDRQGGEPTVAVLEAKTTGIAAGRDCRLAECFVAAGSVVTPGTPLLRFQDERLEARLAAKSREQTEATAELARCEAAADVELAWRRRELQGEIHQTQTELTKLTQEQLTRQVEQLAWQEHLRGLGEWSGDAVTAGLLQPVTLTTPRPDTGRLQALLKEDAAALAAEAVRAQVALSETRLKDLRALLGELDRKVRISVGVDVARTRLDRVVAERATVEAQLAELTIHSPVHGVVGVWRHQPGELVSAGALVVELLDEAQRSLTARIPSQDISVITPGRELTLHFPGDQRRRGRIAPLPPQATSNDGASEGLLPVRIEPMGKLWPELPVGSRVVVELPKATARN